MSKKTLLKVGIVAGILGFLVFKIIKRRRVRMEGFWDPTEDSF
jgi:hypothetical protein